LIGGTILAGIGVLLLLQNLGIPFFDDLERFWPVILIVIGVAHAARSFGLGGKVWGGVVTLAGILFLLSNFNVIQKSLWQFLWPAVLIMVGLGMLARSFDRYNTRHTPEAREAGRRMAEQIRNRIMSDFGAAGTRISRDHMSEWAVFSGVKRRIDSQNFQGGEAFAMFGGVEIDLRKAASTNEEILIEANAIFGGVEVRLPDSWDVLVRGSGIFGGYEDKTIDSRVTQQDGKRPRVIVNGYAVFGGVQIEN
jgi:predicted membrane protein